MNLKINENLEGLAGYASAPPTSQLLGRSIQLSQNELSAALPEDVARAAQKSLLRSNFYPDPTSSALREMLAEQNSLSASRILVGAGSLDLLRIIAFSFTNVDDEVLVPMHSYPFFTLHATFNGARVVESAVDAKLKAIIEMILGECSERTSIVYIANPGNPTGTYLPVSELSKLRAGLPENVLLVIDEAYREFVISDDESAAKAFSDSPNVIVLRTFSKAYGLAAHRIGWATASEDILSVMRKVQVPSSVTSIAQLCALELLKREKLIKERCLELSRRRDAFETWLQSLDVNTTDSQGNFALMLLRSSKEREALYGKFCEQGLFVRPQVAAGLPDALRITIGSEEQMSLAKGIIEESLLQVRSG